MKIQHLAALTLCLGTATGCIRYSGTATSNLSYLTDWNEAVAQSRSRKAPILLNFGGPW